MNVTTDNPAVFPMPLDLDEIDARWMTAALRTQVPDVTVRACEIVDVNRGTCTKIRIHLDLDEAGQQAGIPSSVILKGGFEPHSRQMATMHERETLSYKHIVPGLGLPGPRCFFADYDPERQQGIVILEDLVQSGATFCDPLDTPTYEQAKRRLTVLARFHAKGWDSPMWQEGQPWDWLEEVNELTREYSPYFLEPETWKRFVASPRGAAVSTRFHDRDWMAHALDKLADLAPTLPHCVLHSDTHVANTYIAADGSPGFFDAQPSRGPHMVEIAYNLSCALDSGDRPNWEEPLIRHYLMELEANGAPAPGYDEAMRQFGIFLARVYFIFVINESHYQNESITTAFTARINAAMLDHDTMGLIEAL